jgi:wyosine [tRNA(Phe)-imidazoG37] synthetase (radical SAM superfamily)
MKAVYRHLFGPVLSRRLGTSLGVDIVPVKTCSYDCVFCEVGKTVGKTVVRRNYAPVAGVIREVRSWLKAGGTAQWITVAGSGEPTLHSGLGALIGKLRRATGMRVALLSNGSLFSDGAVRRDAAKADLVKVSLSAWDDESLRAVNRPDRSLRLARIVDGLKRFRDMFHGVLWVEVILVRGVNDGAANVRRIAEIVRGIRPDQVHLNTVVRPPAYRAARPVPGRLMRRLATLFTPVAEVVEASSSRGADGGEPDVRHVERLLRRRPCTAAEVAMGMGWNMARTAAAMEAMANEGRLQRCRRAARVYYMNSSRGA